MGDKSHLITLWHTLEAWLRAAGQGDDVCLLVHGLMGSPCRAWGGTVALGISQGGEAAE